MRAILEDLYQGKILTSSEASVCFDSILRGEVPSAQIASLATVFNMRSITPEEVLGIRSAILKHATKLDLGSDLMDVCGTGGDYKDTFNISTLSSFVLAGAGVRIAKHGNYAASSKCGSSNILEALGVKLTDDVSYLKACLNQTGICFLHAPLFHPSLKAIAQVRKDLNVRTIFNFMGPLVNPANPSYQFSGVYDLKVLRIYSYVLESLKINFGVVHDLEGFDEVSLTASVKFSGSKEELSLTAKDFGFEQTSLNDLKAGDSLETSKQIFLNVLDNKSTKAAKQVVLANAALAYKVRYPDKDLQVATQTVTESLESGKALNVLRQLQELAKV